MLRAKLLLWKTGRTKFSFKMQLWRNAFSSIACLLQEHPQILSRIKNTLWLRPSKRFNVIYLSSVIYLLSNGGLDGVRVIVVTPSSVFSDQEQSKITSVNKFNNFQYVNSSIIVWRAYGVGKGKTVTINSSRRGTFSCQNKTFLHVLFVKTNSKHVNIVFLACCM